MQETYEDTGKRRICRKCLLQEFDEAEYKEKLEKYIVGLDADIKAQNALYQKRLAVCKECDRLHEGTCLSCGCYVELRAAVKSSKCPNKRW